MPTPVCFVVMPYRTRDTQATPPAPAKVNFDALWDKALAPALTTLGYRPVRADQDLGPLIIKDMLERLYFSDLVLADLTTPNGNVYYEVGIRHAARNGGCVLIGADWSQPLFDVDQMRQLRYPLPEGAITDDTAAAIRAVLTASIPTMAQSGSPMYETLDGYPIQVKSERAQVMRDFLEEFSVNAAAHPFDAAATTLTRRNAWWLAEAALLTYWDAAIAIPRFRAAGLEAQLVDAAGLQVYVAWAPALAIVAFRGTEPDEWSDILDDALFKQVPWEAGAGFVHRGFKGALDRGWPVLGPLVDDLGRTRTVWFTGHSLGAALATLAAARYPNTAGALTLGSPRVGDALFSERYRTRFRGRALRYVNDADLVTQVPPPIPFPSVYAHCGELRHISASGDISHQRPRLDHFFQELFADAASVLDLVEALKSGVLHRAPKLLLDHMPRSYAVDIWNDYVRHGN